MFTFQIFGLRCSFHPQMPSLRYPRGHYHNTEEHYNEFFSQPKRISVENFLL